MLCRDRIVIAAGHMVELIVAAMMGAIAGQCAVAVVQVLHHHHHLVVVPPIARWPVI